MADYDPCAVFGTQWGIFAKEDIPEEVLLGEYACDIVIGADLQMCKKMDTIMMLSGRNTPDDTFLAPILYCGFVSLVNSEQEDKCNCATIRVLIGGILRVLLYSTQKIKKGGQLYWNYGSSYKFALSRAPVSHEVI